MFYKDEKLALLIDGMSLYSAARMLDFDIDYKLLRNEFTRRGKLLRAKYYNVVIDKSDSEEDFSPIKPLVDWLEYNGFSVTTKVLREYTDGNGRKKLKGSINVAMAVDAMELAPHVDHLVIFSGDGDLCPLVDSLQRRGVRISVVSTVSGQSMISDELRRIADNFIELDELRNVIGREKRDRSETQAA